MTKRDRQAAEYANEPSPASAGSHGEPALWAAVGQDGRLLWGDRRREVVVRYVVDGTPIVPLYRSPTLTDEEREAMHRLCRAVTHYSADGVAVDGGSFVRDDERAVAVVRGWLARLT